MVQKEPSPPDHLRKPACGRDTKNGIITESETEESSEIRPDPTCEPVENRYIIGKNPQGTEKQGEQNDELRQPARHYLPLRG